MNYDLNDITISDDTLIGCGAVWNVYRNILPGGQSIIVKKSKMKSATSAKSNSEHYGIVKANNFPTLKFLDCVKYQNDFILVGEDLNFKTEKVFVSPNSIAYTSPLFRDEDLSDLERTMLDHMNNEKLRKYIPDAEKFRFESKLTDILELDIFIDESLALLKKAGSIKLAIDFDSYFFGTDRFSNRSKLDLIIADFDHIEFHKKSSQDEVFSDNLSEFKRAISGFVYAFVEENSIRKHIKVIDELCSN